MRASKALKVNDPDVIKDDVLEGLTGVVTVRVAEPQFEGQTKEILGTPAARSVVRRVVSGELKNFLTSGKRGDKAQAKGSSWTRSSALSARASPRGSTRRPSAGRTRLSPPRSSKLADCRAVDNDRTELFIVEGDSALGTAKLARNSEFQALLPIRGKILNVQKASVGDMLKNTECASIIQVVGAGVGADVRHRRRALRPDRLHGRCGLRRRAHPLPARHVVLQVHARADQRGPGLPRSRCASRSRSRRRGWASTSTPTPTTSCSGSWPS